MPNAYSNFTQNDADNSSGGASVPGPAGAGDHGEVWDPNGGVDGKGAYIPRGTQPSPVPPPKPGPGGYTPYGAMGNARDGSVKHSGGSENGVGRVANDLSWGGYSSTVVIGPDGKPVNVAAANGARADVNRYQGMGQAAQARQAYQIDYGDANGFAARARDAQEGQYDAMGLAQQAAMGGNSAARNMGRDMLRQGAQSQQAAALSTRGGPLAQAAAMRQQQAGAGAYAQQGERQMEALRADEMAAGRQQYMGMATGMRGQDAQAQGLSQQQGIQQMGQELGQRGLNDRREQHFEGMALDTEKASADAGMKNQAIDAGVEITTAQNSSNDKARRDLYGGAAMATMGTVIGGMAKSDAGTKQGIRSLADAAIARRSR